MKYVLLIVVLLSSLPLRAQDEHGHDWLARKTAKGDTTCMGYHVALAKDDVSRGSAVLFTEPGCWVTAMSNQHKFEERYGVRYKISGCVLPDRRECLMDYNKLVFHYLDSMYGGKWRRQVRTDVLGYRKRYLIFR